ncbi:MAG: hypothetical protein ABSC20_02670 [Candidatus Bathyarchaeia archaeon]|jgi:hypothetical protein
MKFKQLTVLLILLLILPLFLNPTLTAKATTTQTPPSLYFGVDVAFESIATTEQLIDNVSSYTNFFVIGCTGNYNLTRLTIISQYVYDKGMTFIVYSDEPNYPSSQWLEAAKNNWGNSFLGIYYGDEEGGKQLDQTNYPIVKAAGNYGNAAAENYSDAANKYVSTLNWWIRSGAYAITKNFAYPTEYQLFTSDYALYWYDYEAGYNTVFAEFGWQTGWANDSRQLNVALCRGAATAFNKDWGVMITLTYNLQIESGPALYNDMLLAYENDAKYIIVFDSNQNWTQNVLQQGQLDAMKQFWQYVQANPRTISPVSDRTAYVLPAAYGYGFRGPKDKIWGLWNADSLTIDIGMSVSTLLQMNGNNLDIVYPSQTLESAGYKSIIYWNDTRLIPTTSPQPQQHTSSPFYANTVYLYVIATSILVAVAVAITVLKFRKRRDSPDQKLRFPK